MKTIIRDDVLQSEMIAIADEKGNKVTYRELAKKAERLSGYIEERSLIFILCDKHMETLEFVYEILYLNRVPLMLSDDIDEEFLDNLIAGYRPQYIYCSRERAAGSKYRYELELDGHVLLKTDNRKYPIHSDVALLLSTSGTTGSSKVVKLSYDNLYDNAEYVCMHMDIQRGQKGISPLSISYVYGLCFCIWHWHCGATLLVTAESVLSGRFNEFYEREKANNIAGVPYTYQMLQRIRFWTPEKLKYLHWAMSAGSQMPEREQINLISVMKDKFWIGYGQTECGCIISLMNFDENNIKSGAVGIALNNMEICTDSETKELIVRSKSVCMGYAENSEQMATGDVNHGILYTGDVADIDGDGCIYLRGRLKRFVKILGKRVSLDDVENYLNNKYQNTEFACTGTDNGISVFYSGMQNDEDGIVSLLDIRLRIPKKFVSCIKLESIPRNDAGKVDYSELK